MRRYYVRTSYSTFYPSTLCYRAYLAKQIFKNLGFLNIILNLAK